MTLTIDIKPEAQAALARQAAAQGRAIEAVATALLEEAVNLPAKPPAERRSGQSLVDACAKVRGLLTDEEIDRIFSRNPSTARPVDLS